MSTQLSINQDFSLEAAVEEAFSCIAPFWPLESLLAVNPLQGLEDLSFQEALVRARQLFEGGELPDELLSVNRVTMKWLQVYFDQGQASIPMPGRDLGLFEAWRQLAIFDVQLVGGSPQKASWLKALDASAFDVIETCLDKLRIEASDRSEFILLMLTTLPGWAQHIKYQTDWSAVPQGFTQADYVAMRLVITCLLWPEAQSLLFWHRTKQVGLAPLSAKYTAMCDLEQSYAASLVTKLSKAQAQQNTPPKAQFVFCIDVRSEVIRRSLESVGDYETFGYAGFFGLPVSIEQENEKPYASCPVILEPKHNLPLRCKNLAYFNSATLKRVYQSLKYNAVTPFALVEGLGLFSGLWMGLKTFAPHVSSRVSALFSKKTSNCDSEFDIEAIAFDDQLQYAKNALLMIGLKRGFAPVVVLCGHGSTTTNNAFATSLDCGACGGRHGGLNARILAAILNKSAIRAFLVRDGFELPDSTVFVGAEHNTTTDAVEVYGLVDKCLEQDLKKAGDLCAILRLAKLSQNGVTGANRVQAYARASDWSEVRPEWGLAGNAAFIVAPRRITQGIDLEGRSFLHSYNPEIDADGTLLRTILTAPMVVAQWINAQYLFSSLDNVAYGAGSKVTKNIVGKFGIIQGNSSDLMTGLPLQSVYASSDAPYHSAQRLLVIVYAPCARIDAIIKTESSLQKLFGNQWVNLLCMDPQTQSVYQLNQQFKWDKYGD